MKPTDCFTEAVGYWGSWKTSISIVTWDSTAWQEGMTVPLCGPFVRSLVNIIMQNQCRRRARVWDGYFKLYADVRGSVHAKVGAIHPTSLTFVGIHHTILIMVVKYPRGILVTYHVTTGACNEICSFLPTLEVVWNTFDVQTCNSQENIFTLPEEENSTYSTWYTT